MSPKDQRVNVNDLVGAQEIADAFDVVRTQVYKWRGRNLGFPEPVTELNMGSVWNWPDVLTWGKQTGRLDAEGQPINRRTS